MEHNVVALETAKSLKAAGFPQTREATIFTWVMGTDERKTYKLASFCNPWYGAVTDYHAAGHDNPACPMFAAPTAQEIADELPERVSITDAGPYTKKWSAHTVPFATVRVITDAIGDTMAEALAALYLKLKEPKQ